MAYGNFFDASQSYYSGTKRSFGFLIEFLGMGFFLDLRHCILLLLNDILVWFSYVNT
jgi:hypothetical protein